MVQPFWQKRLFLCKRAGCPQAFLVFCAFTKFVGMACVLALLLPSVPRANPIQHGIQIEKAWVRAVPPNAKATAVYMILKNPTAQEEQLVAASSPIAQVGEIHAVIQENGTMMMKPLKTLTVPPQSEVRLQPGGFHIMLIHLKKVPKVGEQIRLMLEFQNAKKVELRVPVQESQTH